MIRIKLNLIVVEELSSFYTKNGKTFIRLKLQDVNRDLYIAVYSIEDVYNMERLIPGNLISTDLRISNKIRKASNAEYFNNTSLFLNNIIVLKDKVKINNDEETNDNKEWLEE